MYKFNKVGWIMSYDNKSQHFDGKRSLTCVLESLS